MNSSCSKIFMWTENHIVTIKNILWFYDKNIEVLINLGILSRKHEIIDPYFSFVSLVLVNYCKYCCCSITHREPQKSVAWRSPYDDDGLSCPRGLWYNIFKTSRTIFNASSVPTTFQPTTNPSKPSEKLINQTKRQNPYI